MNERTILLIGEDGFGRLQESLVVVAGLGGVGGHCAEALARAGIGALHLIDFDSVQASNLNRQLVASKSTIGRKKTDAMQSRLLDVSDCRVSVSDCRIDGQTVAGAMPQRADYIVDAIDQLSGKLALVLYARDKGIPIISCMGAGNRRDASRFYVTDIYQTAGDPLARRMRQALRKLGIDALDVVYSDEERSLPSGDGAVGSLAPVTAAAGLVAASHVIARLTAQAQR